MKSAERVLAIMMSALALFLLFFRATHAGAIWRDEANSLQLAIMPTLHDVWHNLTLDSFPLLFNLILRAYVDLFGTNDFVLRAFGIAVGVLMVAAAWWNVRAFAAYVPLIFLAIVATNATWLVSGTAARGYGIGALAILIAFGLAANLVARPNRKRLFVFALVCLIAVHLVYFNIALVAAISAGLIAVFLVRKQLHYAVVVGSIAAVCFISWIPYLQLFASLDWRIVLTSAADLSVRNILIKFGEVVGNGTIALALIWFASVLALLVIGARRLICSLRRNPDSNVPILLFAVTTALTGLVFQYIFLRAVGYSAQPRYFLGLFVIMTAIAELLFGILAQRRSMRVIRCALAAGIILISSVTAWPKLAQHQTNINIAADTLEKNAGPNDLIIIDRETIGVSFNWYYHGTTHWETVPILPDHRLHRDDLLKTKMMEQEPIRDLEDEIAKTLRAANRVWFVHDINESNRSLPVAPLAPAPDPRVGWNEWAYREVWAREIMLFFQTHSKSVGVALPSLPNDGAIENVTVFLAQGWRD